MKAVPPADTSGTSPEPLAFFLHSGAYSSFVLLAKPRGEDDLLALMDADTLWESDCVQLTESAVFSGVGSDVVNQAVWVYLDGSGKSDPPERRLNARFASQGEPVYLESLIDMTFDEGCDQFYLPAGEYEVSLLSWNFERARDNFDADLKLVLENVHHELRFDSAVEGFVPRHLPRRDGADGRPWE